MAPISLKIVLDGGAVTRKVKFDSQDTVDKAYEIVKDKVNVEPGKDYGFFLRSADDDLAGVWLERQRTLDYYMLRDGDPLDYICKSRVLRVKMLDGSVKTMQVDQSKTIANLMMDVCSRIGITNHDEYGLCREEEDESEEGKGTASATSTMKRKLPHKEKDPQLEMMSKKLKTDDNVQWLDHHRTLRETASDPAETLLLKRRLFYSDRNVDARDPVQLNLLYVQTRDAILNGRHPVTEDLAVDCKVRWINIRDVHRRICKKKAAEPDNKSKSYKYEKEMAFMKAYYKDIVPYSQDEDDNDDQWNDGPVDSDSSKSDEPAKKPAPKRHKAKKTQERSYEEPEKAPSTSFAEAPSEFDTTDPVDAFLLSIGASLKNFSPYHLNLAKSKIFAVVQEHELQQIMQKQSADVKIVGDIVFE